MHNSLKAYSETSAKVSRRSGQTRFWHFEGVGPVNLTKVNLTNVSPASNEKACPDPDTHADSSSPFGLESARPITK